MIYKQIKNRNEVKYEFVAPSRKYSTRYQLLLARSRYTVFHKMIARTTKFSPLAR